MARQTWLIYALGGGWGHLNRAIALGRIAAREVTVKILTNSPYGIRVAAYLAAWKSQGQAVPELVCLAADLPHQAICRQVQEILRAENYTCLIVDTFPRGLGGELVERLPQLPCPTILIHRDLSPAYMQAKQLQPWVERHYDQVLVPGEGAVPLAHLPQTRHTAPWVMFSPLEIAQNPQPRLNPNQPLVLVCASGNPAEAAMFGEITHYLATALPETTVRCLAHDCPPPCPPELWWQYWPGMPLIAQAQIVVGSGGYNTVAECEALQVPLVALPMPRLYDRQARRLERYGDRMESAAAAIARVKRHFQGATPMPLNPIPQTYINGAEQSFALIQNAIAR